MARVLVDMLPLYGLGHGFGRGFGLGRGFGRGRGRGRGFGRGRGCGHGRWVYASSKVSWTHQEYKYHYFHESHVISNFEAPISPFFFLPLTNYFSLLIQLIKQESPLSHGLLYYMFTLKSLMGTNGPRKRIS